MKYSPFISDLGMERNVPIVEGALAHDCPFTGEVYVLVLRNALHVPSTDHNLILLFIMRSSSVAINDAPKIHCGDPAVDDYCVLFDQSGLRKTLQSNGVFSCFHTRVPTEREIHECTKLFLTLDSSDLNLHCQSYERS